MHKWANQHFDDFEKKSRSNMKYRIKRILEKFSMDMFMESPIGDHRYKSWEVQANRTW